VKAAPGLPDRLLDVNEAALLLGVTKGTLYQWAYQRRIPVVKPSGPRGPLRFRLTTLMALIESWERPALTTLSMPAGRRVVSRQG
jgi:excisionase family DNA binding protein